MVFEGFNMQEFIQEISSSFRKTFITDDRWLKLLKGLGATIEITLFAAVLGILLGFIVAIIRSSHDLTRPNRLYKTFGDTVLSFLNGLCNIYITVIRGTPVVIQLMIMYYVIFASSRNGMIAAILAFGINSGAYVAEIVRGGIMSIDSGQFEASRSLGFNYVRTMIYVILPQTLKNVLPALGNEFIVLLKETSVAGYVALQDLTYIGNLIRSRTYEAFFPLITVALIYLVIVMGLTYLLRRLERRLRKNER